MSSFSAFWNPARSRLKVVGSSSRGNRGSWGLVSSPAIIGRNNVERREIADPEISSEVANIRTGALCGVLAMRGISTTVSAGVSVLTNGPMPLSKAGVGPASAPGRVAGSTGELTGVLPCQSPLGSSNNGDLPGFTGGIKGLPAAAVENGVELGDANSCFHHSSAVFMPGYERAVGVLDGVGVGGGRVATIGPRTAVPLIAAVSPADRCPASLM